MSGGAFFKNIHIYILMFIFFLREREHEQGRGREREGDRRSEAGSVLTAASPMRGLNSGTVRS